MKSRTREAFDKFNSFLDSKVTSDISELEKLKLENQRLKNEINILKEINNRLNIKNNA